MSAIPSDIRLETEPDDQLGERRHGLPLSASVYEFIVAVAAVAVAVPFIVRLNGHTHGWATFGILAAGAAAPHLHRAHGADTSFHTSWVFLIPAAMLLPPELVALVGVVMHVPEWLKERYAWYIQTFNICNYTLGNLATWGRAADPATRPGSSPTSTFAGRLPGSPPARRRRGEPRPARADDHARARPLAARGRALLVREPLDRLRSRHARARASPRSGI